MYSTEEITSETGKSTTYGLFIYLFAYLKQANIEKKTDQNLETNKRQVFTI